MIDGVILGVLTFISMVLSFKHLPNKIKAFFIKHMLLTDILSIVITFLALASISHSITSVIGSIVCGVLVNLALEWENNNLFNKEEDTA